MCRRGQLIIQPVLGQVYSDGTVLYTPPMQTKTHCDLDLTYYPFDIQTCGLMVASWTYDGTAVNNCNRFSTLDIHLTQH